MHVLKTLNGEPDTNPSQQDDQLDRSKLSSFGKLYSAILLSPGDVVSLPKLTTKGLFRPVVNGISGRQLMLMVSFLYKNKMCTKSNLHHVKNSNAVQLLANLCCNNGKKINASFIMVKLIKTWCKHVSFLYKNIMWIWVLYINDQNMNAMYLLTYFCSKYQAKIKRNFHYN